MRLHIGLIPETPDFTPDGPWRPLREPTPWVMQLMALPVAIIAGAILGILWAFLTPLRTASWPSFGVMIVTFFALIPIHELVHLGIHPCSGVTESSIVGFWPSKMLFFAHYTGELSRSRFMAILLMPLLVISFVPLIACAIIGCSVGLLVFASVANGLFACGDILGAGLLLCQVPPRARLRNQGWRTFWRVVDTKNVRSLN
jgi:hypothetical protein